MIREIISSVYRRAGTQSPAFGTPIVELRRMVEDLRRNMFDLGVWSDDPNGGVVSYVVKPVRDKEHGQGIFIDSGTAEAYEGFEVTLFEDGFVTGVGGDESITDFLTRSAEEFHTTDEIQEALNAYYEHWKQSEEELAEDGGE